ncbi:hypothetical protein Tco_1531252 [Tanacetum coccineum]
MDYSLMVTFSLLTQEVTKLKPSETSDVHPSVQSLTPIGVNSAPSKQPTPMPDIRLCLLSATKSCRTPVSGDKLYEQKFDECKYNKMGGRGCTEKMIRSTKDMLKSSLTCRYRTSCGYRRMGYSDAKIGYSDIKDSRFGLCGYVFTLGGAAISWKSSKQTVIAKSTMESKFAWKTSKI